jgi:hypothetical protein
MTAQFTVGETYTCRSMSDYDCIFSWKVVARTAKQLTLEQYGKTFKRGIYVYEGTECCRPSGSYSMAPVIRANRAYEG